MAAFSYSGRAPSHYPYRQHYRSDSDSNTSALDDLRAFLARAIRRLWRFWNERGRHMAAQSAVSGARRLRRNLEYQRLVSLPHLLVGLWVLVLLWGERWAFEGKVEGC